MENSSPNNTPKPLNRLNKTLVERPYNPLYDGRSGDSVPKFNQLYLIPIMCLLVLLYLNTQEETPIKQERELSTAEKITNNRLLFDEDGNEIAEIGTKSDPHNYVDSVYSPNVYGTKTVRERGIYVQNNTSNNYKPSRNKPPKRTILTDLDDVKNSLVFAGSFVNQDNADKTRNAFKNNGL